MEEEEEGGGQGRGGRTMRKGGQHPAPGSQRLHRGGRGDGRQHPAPGPQRLHRGGGGAERQRSTRMRMISS
eukprot:365888-Chlamydomonas_euryale.AAC.2